MDSAAWKQLFEGFRPADQECLVVSVAGGLDVAVQSVAKVEEDVVLLRGRVSGQADVGRIFIVPYDRLNNVYVNRYVQVEETELFSPSVSLQRKDEIAKMVQQMKEKMREEAQAAEMTRNSGSVNTDIRKQLEELREKQEVLRQQNAQTGENKASLPAPRNEKPEPPPTATRTNIPGRFTLSKKSGDG